MYLALFLWYPILGVFYLVSYTSFFFLGALYLALVSWYPILGPFSLVLFTWYFIHFIHGTLRRISALGVAGQSSSIRPPLGLSPVECHCNTKVLPSLVQYKSSPQSSVIAIPKSVTTYCTRFNCCFVQIVKHAKKCFRRV